MTDIEVVFRYETAVESFVAICSLWVNLYFIVRISDMSTLNVNLRVILIAETLNACIINIAHPLEHLVSPRLYSIAEGNVIGALLYYSLMVLAHIGAFLIDWKYLLIAIERVISYRNRETYEHRGWVVAAKLLAISIFVCVMLMSIKVHILWNYYDGLEIDVLLRKTLLLDSNVYGLVFIFVYGSVSLFVSVCILYWLNCRTVGYQHKFDSLSACYEIRQTRYVIKYLKSLLKAVCFLVSLSTIIVLLLLHFYVVIGLPTESYEIRTLISLMFIILCGYNTLSMFYMIGIYPELQKSIYRDLPFLERSSIRRRIKIMPGDADLYFRHLKETWE